MRIQTVAERPELFAVSHCVSLEILEEINSINWWNVPYQAKDMTDRRILYPEYHDVQKKIAKEIQNWKDPIDKAAGRSYGAGIFWVDWHLCEPGYRSLPHIDGTKPNTMILFWISPGVDYGTEFYASAKCDQKIHEFPGTPNTGWLAIYDKDSNFNWHAAPNPVPAGQYRLISAVTIQI